MNETFAPVAMPKTMDYLRITESASQQATLRRYLGSHLDWIECQLGCQMEEALLLEFDKVDLSFAQLALEGLFPDSSGYTNQTGRMDQLQKVVKTEFPSYFGASF